MALTSVSVRDELAAAGFSGPLVAPGDPGYDEARSVHNAMIDRRPTLIARCGDAADVAAAVDEARARGLLLSVRGGGHNAGGLGVADDALCIDLRDMHAIRVDPDSGFVRVEGGATLGQVDHATHQFGLAVPMGILSTTGIGGLCLGGGMGYLTRRHGLTIDRLREADVVLADGRVVTTSPHELPDLFWALRGGGGNFGVVTSMLFEPAPVKHVIAGPMFWPMEMAPDVMRFWDGLMADAPRDLYGFFAFLSVPPGPPFPTELHGERVCGIAWCHTGTAAEAAEALAPAREFGPPILDGVGEMPLPAWNSAFDALYPPGMQLYWKADFVDELDDEAIALHAEHGARLPSPLSTMHLYPIDGAVHDIAPDATAWRHRSSRYSEVIVGVDPDPANAGRIRDWTRAYWDAVHPKGAGGAYVNFLQGDEGEDRVRAAYGANYDRLVAVKREYDPQNLFRVNHNIVP